MIWDESMYYVVVQGYFCVDFAVDYIECPHLWVGDVTCCLKPKARMVWLNMCESVLDRSLMWMFRSPSTTILLYFVILFARSSVISFKNIALVMLLPGGGWYIPMIDVQWLISRYFSILHIPLCVYDLIQFSGFWYSFCVVMLFPPSCCLVSCAVVFQKFLLWGLTGWSKLGLLVYL